MAQGNGLFGSSSHADEARRAAKQAMGKGREAAHLASRSAREAGAALADEASARVGDAKHRAAGIASDLKDQAGDRALDTRDYLMELLGALSGKADTVVKTARNTLKDVHAEDYAKTAAVYSGKAIGLVKRHPLIAIGGAVAIGFLIGKAVEAAAARREAAEAEAGNGVSAGEGDTADKD